MRSIATNILVLTFSVVAVGVAQPSQDVAQTSSSPDGGRDRLTVEAVRVRNGTPEIDGRLDEEAWQSARWIDDFHQKEPDYGQDPKNPTEIAFLFDDGAL
jgi:hypothetical protein